MISPNNTYFFDREGRQLASDEGLLSVPLYKGMKFTIHGHDGAFEVVEWEFHHGHADEHPGLRIVLQRKPATWKHIEFKHL